MCKKLKQIHDLKANDILHNYRLLFLFFKNIMTILLRVFTHFNTNTTRKLSFLCLTPLNYTTMA